MTISFKHPASRMMPTDMAQPIIAENITYGITHNNQFVVNFHWLNSHNDSIPNPIHLQYVENGDEEICHISGFNDKNEANRFLQLEKTAARKNLDKTARIEKSPEGSSFVIYYDHTLDIFFRIEDTLQQREETLMKEIKHRLECSEKPHALWERLQAIEEPEEDQEPESFWSRSWLIT